MSDLAAGFFGALEALVKHASQAGAGGRSPSDLPLVALTQGELEELERRHPQLEDVLPLSPLQEGLLFHALYDARGPDVYTVQLDLELLGELDVVRLEASLAAVVERHASLRAGFLQDGLSAAVQVIVARAPPRLRLTDLSGLAAAAQAAGVERVAAAERDERFDVAQAPLLRFALIRLSGERHRLLLSSHHLLMDGWSAPVLVGELLAIYGRGGDGSQLPRVTPYREYLAYLAGQDRPAARAAWRETLAGLEEGTRLAPSARERGAVAPARVEHSVGVALSGSLRAQARRAGVTLNTLIQVGWGVLLGRLSGRSDVVFGVTVAGRPAEIAGIERMVGLFINTLPLRLELSAGQSLSDLLRQTQDRQAGLLAHQHLGLAEIQQLAGLGELFDTLVVFENYPVDRVGLAAEADGLRLGAVRGHDATHYPLSLVVQPGEERLQLRLDYRPDLFERGSVEVVAERLIRLLAAAAAARRIARSGRSRCWRPRSGRPSWSCGTRPRSRWLRRPCRRCSARRLCARRTRWRWCSRNARCVYAELEAHANQLAHHLRIARRWARDRGGLVS